MLQPAVFSIALHSNIAEEQPKTEFSLVDLKGVFLQGERIMKIWAMVVRSYTMCLLGRTALLHEDQFLNAVGAKRRRTRKMTRSVLCLCLVISFN